MNVSVFFLFGGGGEGEGPRLVQFWCHGENPFVWRVRLHIRLRD